MGIAARKSVAKHRQKWAIVTWEIHFVERERTSRAIKKLSQNIYLLFVFYKNGKKRWEIHFCGPCFQLFSIQFFMSRAEFVV